MGFSAIYEFRRVPNIPAGCVHPPSSAMARPDSAPRSTAGGGCGRPPVHQAGSQRGRVLRARSRALGRRPRPARRWQVQHARPGVWGSPSRQVRSRCSQPSPLRILAHSAAPQAPPGADSTSHPPRSAGRGCHGNRAPPPPRPGRELTDSGRRLAGAPPLDSPDLQDLGGEPEGPA